MKNFAPALIEKAKMTKSAEELLALAKENQFELAPEEAAMVYNQLNQKSGEVSDEELDSVAGGACHTDGHTVVSSCLDCFTGQYAPVKYDVFDTRTGKKIDVQWMNTSNMSLRETWFNCSFARECCGRCRYLEFDGSTDYCSKT